MTAATARDVGRTLIDRREPVSQPGPSTIAPLASALLVVIAGAVTLPLVDMGPVSFRMMQHLALMNVAAPLLGACLAARLKMPCGPRWVWLAALAQMVLLWAWHVPSVQQATTLPGFETPLMVFLLTAAALAFWTLLLHPSTADGWAAPVVLALTGKLSCLLGALLIFAPRDLYQLRGAVSLCAPGASSLEDQHLAGLLMVTACPLSYLVAGVALIARLLALQEDPSVVRKGRSVASG